MLIISDLVGITVDFFVLSHFNLLIVCFQVIDFFTRKLEKEEDQSTDVNVVMSRVQQAALQWPTDRLKVTSSWYFYF